MLPAEGPFHPSLGPRHEEKRRQDFRRLNARNMHRTVAVPEHPPAAACRHLISILLIDPTQRTTWPPLIRALASSSLVPKIVSAL